MQYLCSAVDNASISHVGPKAPGPALAQEPHGFAAKAEENPSPSEHRARRSAVTLREGWDEADTGLHASTSLSHAPTYHLCRDWPNFAVLLPTAYKGVETRGPFAT